LRTRLRSVVVINLPAAVIPAIAAAVTAHAITSHRDDSASFYVAVLAAAVLANTLSFAIMATLRRVCYPSWSQIGPRAFLEALPSIALNVLLVVAGAGITVKLGNAGITFALSAVFTFSYMAHLLDRSRQRAEQYVSLSWGVLAGLLRALDIRDGRAARHAAAVARFASDMAEAVGMSEHDQELAHTAGLLHDIGHFALSDRVAERGRTLTEEDWVAIQQHPELGADMLRDLGMYGPIAEIVHAHHERIDGRGYPMGLAGDEIPEFARVLAVADAFDAMTSTRSYSHARPVAEAIAELRKWAGKQFDPAFVDAFVAAIERDGWKGPQPVRSEPATEPDAILATEIIPQADGQSGPLIAESM